MGHMPPVEGDYQDMQTPVSDHGQAEAGPVVQQDHSQPSHSVEPPPELEEAEWYE